MSYFPCDIPFMSEEEKRDNGIFTPEKYPLNTKIMLSVETEVCTYWDEENNRPTHTCNACAEPDNHYSVMIDGKRYCLLDFDIAGEICRGNVPKRWIPVTERLPEDCEYVLGWIERDKWGKGDKPTKTKECAIGWQIKGRWHFDGYGSKGTKCLAWRPLPEPYTEEDEEEKRQMADE